VIPDQVEREILIEAPVDVVWRIVTEPDQIVQWFSDEAEFDLRPGGEGHLRFKGSDQYAIQVEAVEPPRRFAFRWAYAHDSRPRERSSMLVEFTLQQEADKTRVRVVESGFDKVDWSDDEMAKYADDHGTGWSHHLGRLRDFAKRDLKPAPRK
jgi:uncharacterized protein YndB with AHSA1/START domain